MALYINGNKASGGTDIVHLTQAQYDALPNSKNYDGKVYMITDTNGDSSQFQPVVYSEEEREIGVWIDGKPLYKKTLKLSNTLTISANSWGDVQTLSEQLDINYAEGVNNTGSETVYYLIGANCDTNKLLTVLNYRNLPISLNEITLRYTKTTDTAGSGTWTPQGVPAVHYSTDEQVVGVDEEGNTLYEKFYRVANVYSTNTVIDSTKTPANTKIKGLIFGSFTIGGAYNNTQYCTPHIGTNADIRIFMNENGLSINAEGFDTSTHPITDCYFRIQYIKTQGGA